jgi:hypothetical protein
VFNDIDCIARFDEISGFCLLVKKYFSKSISKKMSQIIDGKVTNQ